MCPVASDNASPHLDGSSVLGRSAQPGLGESRNTSRCYDLVSGVGGWNLSIVYRPHYGVLGRRFKESATQVVYSFGTSSCIVGVNV